MIRHNISSGSVFLLILFFSCKPVNNFYQGIVLNENNQPLNGVIVQEYKMNNETTTNKNGYFKLKRTPQWLGDIIFIKPGYRTDTIPTVWHQAGETTNYNFITNDTTKITLEPATR